MISFGHVREVSYMEIKEVMAIIIQILSICLIVNGFNLCVLHRFSCPTLIKETKLKSIIDEKGINMIPMFLDPYPDEEDEDNRNSKTKTRNYFYWESWKPMLGMILSKNICEGNSGRNI